MAITAYSRHTRSMLTLRGNLKGVEIGKREGSYALVLKLIMKYQANHEEAELC
jgi:hypothetical protein